MNHQISPERLHGLDAIRGSALMLGVALHATMSWIPGAEYFWVAADGDRSTTLAVFFFWVHSFRMTLFFLVAGYFARMLLQRRGTKGFIVDRVKRIVVPGATLWFPILMAMVAVITWNVWLKSGGSLPDTLPEPLTVATFPLMHLWFLYLLTMFYVGALVIRGCFKVIDRHGRFQGVLDALVRWVFPIAPLLVALPLAAILMSLPTWWAWFGIPTPDTGLLPNAAALFAYGVAFGCGWALQRQPCLLQAMIRLWPVYLILAVIATVGSLAMIGLVPSPAPAGDTVADMLIAYLYPLGGWAWSFALIGIAQRFLSTPSATRRWIADASYWVYLVHVPLVMALQVVAARIDAPWWIEYPLALAVATALLLGSYKLLVRHTWIGGVLNGRRVPRTRPAAAALAGST